MNKFWGFLFVVVVLLVTGCGNQNPAPYGGQQPTDPRMTQQPPTDPNNPNGSGITLPQMGAKLSLGNSERTFSAKQASLCVFNAGELMVSFSDPEKHESIQIHLENIGRDERVRISGETGGSIRIRMNGHRVHNRVVTRDSRDISSSCVVTFSVSEHFIRIRSLQCESLIPIGHNHSVLHSAEGSMACQRQQ